MATLIFKAADVRRVVEHSLNAPAQALSLSMNLVEEPAVLLVHDQGVYLMSNGEPRDLVDNITSFCAYAKGCDPKKDADCWEMSRYLVGGDGFGETLPWAKQLKDKLDAGTKTITIELGADSIELI